MQSGGSAVSSINQQPVSAINYGYRGSRGQIRMSNEPINLNQKANQLDSLHQHRSKLQSQIVQQKSLIHNRTQGATRFIEDSSVLSQKPLSRRTQMNNNPYINRDAFIYEARNMCSVAENRQWVSKKSFTAINTRQNTEMDDEPMDPPIKNIQPMPQSIQTFQNVEYLSKNSLNPVCQVSVTSNLMQWVSSRPHSMNIPSLSQQIPKTTHKGNIFNPQISKDIQATEWVLRQPNPKCSML